ncbi:MAG: hypothetical protein E7583_01965 [Ruminococcaceae bacterium]|nr:hypothetical protein [Oscillospiraceae bacterium]
MHNDRNMSRDENKNAVSLDNIIDQFGKNSGGSYPRTERLGDTMKKLDEMFEKGAEDLAWLDNIMNGTGETKKDTVQENVADNGAEGSSAAKRAVPGSIITPDRVIPEDDVEEGVFANPIDNAEDIIQDNAPFNAQDNAQFEGAPVDEGAFGNVRDDANIYGAQSFDTGASEAAPDLDDIAEDDVQIYDNAQSRDDVQVDDVKIYGDSAQVAQAVQDVVPDPSVMPQEDELAQGVEGVADMQNTAAADDIIIDDDIFNDDAPTDIGFGAEEEQVRDDVIIAENADTAPDLDGFSADDDTKIFVSSSNNNGDEDYSGWEAPDNTNGAVGDINEQPVFEGNGYAQDGNVSEDGYTDMSAAEGASQDASQNGYGSNYVGKNYPQGYGKNYPNGQMPGGNEDAGTPDLDMFEGTAPEGEYVHNVEMAAQQQENNVNSSLGRLFGVDIPDDDHTNNRKSSKKRSEHKKIAAELGAYEEINMADPEAVDNAKRRFFLKRRHSMISLFGATLFFLVSLYFELSMLGVLPLPEIISPKVNPLMFALADLQVMCFGAIFVLDSLVGGFYSLIDRKFSPASCALTVFVTCTAQAVISAVFAADVKMQLFCCVGCLSIFMLALYDSLRASADNKSFAIASSTANKYGAYELSVNSLECSPFASHIDLEKAKVISVNKGSVYEGFVGRNEKMPEGEKKLGRLVTVITILSVLVGVFVGIFSDGNVRERIYDGITGASIVITSSIPLNIFFVSALPKYLAVKKGKKIGATLVGQNASEEYKGLSVVAFDDTEVFLPKDVRISSIKTYGGMALDEAVITMSNIYNKIGGPLSKIFSKMVDIKNVRSEVRLVKVYPDAIEVNVDGRDICLATASYLGANGIRIINDSVDAAFEQSHGSILFMVCSGRILSKFYIKYSMNPIFEKTLRELHDANLCIGIKTLDPCITNDLVFGCLERTNYALSVIKGNSSNDIPTVRNKVNSGVIALGSVHSFLEMLLVCEKTGRNVKINNVLKMISAIMCIALSTMFVLTNNGSLNIIFCLLIQLFWLLPVTAVSYFNR